MLLPNHILYQTTLNNIQYQTKPHYVNCIRETVSFEGFKQLGSVWFQKVMYYFSFLLFYIQILNLKKNNNNKKKNTLVMFGKLFWIHNLNLEYIILRFGHFFFLNNFSHSHTSHHSKKSNLLFSQYLRICHYMLENKNT